MNVKTESALDYFKDTWNKREMKTKTQSTEDYFKNLSVKNSYGIQASNTHRQEEKERPLKTLMNSGINECKVITYNGDVNVSVSACNRIEAIETYDLSLSYADCTKVEATDKPGYAGYRVYNLYRYNPYANNDTIYMVIAVR